MNSITESLRNHYSEKFLLHGPTSEGVDWGADESAMFLRYDKMLAVVESAVGDDFSLLDVGCGYGGLLTYLPVGKNRLDYTGIDVADNMIDWASVHHDSGNFLCGDILDCEFSRRFDYVVCNGILTQKLEASAIDMDRFAGELIRKMFALCDRGIAFNLMTTKVNFFSNNLYYRSSTEMLAWCISEISPYIKIDHAYPLYEYTVYLYRQPVLSTISPDSSLDAGKTPR